LFKVALNFRIQQVNRSTAPDPKTRCWIGGTDATAAKIGGSP
jgi:hypothetical protein